MPIHHDAAIRLLSDQEFNELDHLVMACAFEAQNALGRLCEETVYEQDLAARLRAAGCQVATQVPVRVSYEGFEKVYRLDLIVNGMLYELKALRRLSNFHETQAYHYAALVGADRVKLLNFGGGKVEGRLLACPFAKMDRFNITVNRQKWQALSEHCLPLSKTAELCFQEWGGFIDCQLISEVLLHVHGRKMRLPVIRDGNPLGHHAVMLHDDATGFEISALLDTAAHANHLKSILNHLPLRAWQWINIRGKVMTFETICR